MLNILDIHVVNSEELPDDIQHTKERKPDVLKKITDYKGNIFVLQIEFQVVDEHEMIYRMAEYHVMLERKYHLPVEQFVIFLGSSKPKMSVQIDNKYMKFKFNLICFSELDYHIFVDSNKPEEIILGILASFMQEDSEVVLKQIIYRIKETTEGSFSLSRYFNQLRVLAQLRNLDLKLEIAMESIAKYINEERDVLYLRGQKKEQIKFVENLLRKLNLTFDQVADIAGVSVEFVKKVHQELYSEK